MYIYTVKKQKIKKKRPKFDVSGVKDTAKTNIDVGISCYIQVEYSVFFHW